ncbi:MAG: hypothetical protein AOA65_2068 [Candidatus Bathyarchaeota archaeon BA1]|nr:MAG: hypothetical protein AOA65_2068 [Candidatus Bathyarchaeota archaeon BA1]
MSDSERTWVFWVGLIVVGLASVALFGISWFMLVFPSRYWYEPLKVMAPGIVGSLVFIAIGLYMMKSGAKQPLPPS